jgi:hypothetical protein
MSGGRWFQRGCRCFIWPGGFGLGCTGDGCYWASWAAVRGGIVRRVQEWGEWRRWVTGLAAKRAASVPLQEKRCAARAFRCMAVQGEGVVVSGARCRARACAERD